MHVDPLNDRHCYADDGADIVDVNANPEDEDIYRTKEVYLGKDAVFGDYFKEIPELEPEPDTSDEPPEDISNAEPPVETEDE